MLYLYCDNMKRCFLIIILLALLLPLFINIYIILNDLNKIGSIDNLDNKYDIALVLGCSVLSDNTPSKMLKDRLDMGISLFNEKKVSKILISGDHKEGYSEIDVMHKYLNEHGILDEYILIDKKGYSTSDSLLNYKNDYYDKSVIIVTQKYHLYRAMYIASKLDLDFYGVHAKLINYNGFIYREIREILARNKDFFKFLGY